MRSSRVTPLSLAGEPKLMATLLRGDEARAMARSRGHAFNTLAVDKDVVADDLDEDRAEPALPDPSAHAEAGQGQCRLHLVDVADECIEDGNWSPIHRE